MYKELVDLKRHILVFALYTLLTLTMTAPVISHLATHVAGQGGDPWQTMWRFENEWENRDFLRVFGGGEARLINVSVWPWMGLHVVLGQPTAYNLVYLLSFVLSGYFMYLLVRYLVVQHSENPNDQIPNPKLREAAPFLVGVLYMFLPFHVAHSLGHFGAMQTQWLPLAILLLFMWVRQPTLWRTVGLAFVIALQSWSEHHYALWLAIFAVVWVVFRRQKIKYFTQEFSILNFKFSNVVLLLSLIFVFAILPWWPTVRLAAEPTNSLELGVEQTIRFSTDVFSYITPPPWQPIWGEVSHELFGRNFTGNIVEATQFLGFLPLLLLLFFHQTDSPTAETLLAERGGSFFDGKFGASAPRIWKSTPRTPALCNPRFVARF